MTAVITLPPDFYHGERLCERCGDNGRGERFAICAEGYLHENSCELYRYDGLCAACVAEVMRKSASSAREGEDQ